MAAGSPDLVDCARLADAGAMVEREYTLDSLPRLKGLLAEPCGVLRARFAFDRLAGGRVGATLAIEACPRLICQRCLQGCDWPVSGGSRVEFTADADADPTDAQREAYVMQEGRASLRDLAEEELLLALPVAPLCPAPQACGRTPPGAGGQRQEAAAATRRPFAGLQDLLKKTDS